MSSIKTKIFTCILSTVMLTSILPTTTVFADTLDKSNTIKIECANSTTAISGKCGKNLKWKLEGLTLTIYGKGKMYNYKGEGAAPWANSGSTAIIKAGFVGSNTYAHPTIKIIIKNGVTSIGNYAFAGLGYGLGPCTVSLPKSLKTIGSHAFGDSMLTSIYIPKNVTSIGTGAFYRCPKLTSVTGGAGLKTIGSYAFATEAGCFTALKTVKITSRKLKKIGKCAFANCKNLTTLNLPNTTMLSSSRVRKSLLGSSIKTIKVKSYKVKYYKKYFKKSNSGRKVTVKKA